MGSHNRNEGEICAKKRESVPIVKGGIRRGEGVCSRTAKKDIYPTIKITADGTSILCKEEGWK